jgi:sigma-E factor negative regulatory protein RseB
VNLGLLPWRRQFGRLGVGVALLSCATLASAPALAGEAEQWLQRIQQAAAVRNYHGTMTTSVGGVVTSSRIAHLCIGRDRYERIEVLDGQMRRQYRHNGRTVTLWPQSRVAVVEQQEGLADFPALPTGGARTLDSYELRSIGQDRVAGHEAEVLVLKPRDAHRYKQRFWVERETGLLLRADVIGLQGELLETSAFTDLTIGASPSRDSVIGPMKKFDEKKVDGYRVLRPHSVRTQIETEGWALNRAVPGFQLVSCAKRPLDPVADGQGAEPALQAVFSDGLTHVSVFVERYDVQRHKPMRTALGATSTLMNRRGDWWITVVGDVPMATVQQFEAMWQRKP